MNEMVKKYLAYYKNKFLKMIDEESK